MKTQTWTSDMVTEMFLGCTVSSTHWRWSEANLWGSPARSQRSLREQLQQRHQERGGQRWGREESKDVRKLWSLYTNHIKMTNMHNHQRHAATGAITEDKWANSSPIWLEVFISLPYWPWHWDRPRHMNTHYLHLTFFIYKPGLF